MAYIAATEAKEIRNNIKKQFTAKEGWKFSIRVRHHSCLDITILTAPFDMNSEDNAEKASKVKQQLDTLGKGNDWFDKSDSMTDYFHVKHYVSVTVGSWDKEFVVVEPKAKKAEKLVEAPVEAIDYSTIDDQSLANTYQPIEAHEEVVIEVEACVEDSQSDYWAVLDQPKQEKEIVEAKQAPVEYEKNLEIIETIIREDSNSLSQVIIQLYKGLTHIGSFRTEHAAKKIASYMGTGMYNLICRDGFKFHSSFRVATS